jgi:hypothetical protein
MASGCQRCHGLSGLPLQDGVSRLVSRWQFGFKTHIPPPPIPGRCWLVEATFVVQQRFGGLDSCAAWDTVHIGLL